MGGLFRVLLLLGIVVKFWWLIVVVVTVVCAGYVVWSARQLHHEQQRRQHAALVARADEQHAQVLAGDERGVYGDYPPGSDLMPAQRQTRQPDRLLEDNRRHGLSI